MMDDMTFKCQHDDTFDADPPRHRHTKSLDGIGDVPSVIIALSNHRCEMVPLAVQEMRRCEIVVLEEPPDDNFFRMLNGKVSIQEYVSGADTEYPEFGLRMAQALRGLNREGKRIVQIEPYLENLIEVHNRLIDGATPSELETDDALGPVYDMERRATRALIDFYEASSQNDFDTMVKTTKAFAKIDARRFAMRDRLRARSIAGIVAHGRRVYVEAGQMHVGLARALRRHLPERQPVVARYLAPERIFRQPALASRLGPGDVLTLVYIFNPDFDSSITDVWAARALVQNKIILKHEITTKIANFPHTRDEAETSGLVQQLDLDMCRKLLPLIDKSTTAQARLTVEKALIDGENRKQIRT